MTNTMIPYQEEDWRYLGRLKKNLNVDDRVKFHRTSDPILDSLTGTIVGKSFDNICDSYIVLLDKPYMGQKAISITEACIDLITLELGVSHA